jgi:hypothetical protein
MSGDEGTYRAIEVCPDFMAAIQLCGEIAHGENLQYLAGVYEFV